ncbi:hypothetical protein GCM10010358_41220 [Streptomyces minutiscleroticus]|uniref:Uncharacterized protein n=1 Tax=Streptomyces minutiscleroticus TaxID=68238 RepID=A0A918U1Z2_9ACTN|nr:hypothetical protein GCM10010358_41220 [Streptomyces minutiscleroticus]
MVVDDQDSDANHETPFPKLLKSRGDPKAGNGRREYGARSTAAGPARAGPGAASARPPPCRNHCPAPGVVLDCLAP